MANGLSPWDELQSSNAEDNTTLVKERLAEKEAEFNRLQDDFGQIQQDDAYFDDGEVFSSDTCNFDLVYSHSGRSPISGVDVTADGMVVATSWDGSGQLFSLEEYRPIENFSASPEISQYRPPLVGVACAQWPGAQWPDLTFCIALESEVQMWSCHENEEGKIAISYNSTSEVKRGPLLGVCMHPTQVLAGCWDQGGVYLWEMDRRKTICNLQFGQGVSDLEFLGYRDFYAHAVASSGRDGTVRLWDTRRERQLNMMKCSIGMTSISCHEGTHLLAAADIDGGVHMWDLRMYRKLHCLSISESLGSRDYARSLRLSPSGEFLACGCVNGEVLLYDLQEGSKFDKGLFHTESVMSVAWAPSPTWASEGDCLVCGSLDGSWSCWVRSEVAHLT